MPGPVAYHVHEGSLTELVISRGLAQVSPRSFEWVTQTCGRDRDRHQARGVNSRGRGRRRVRDLASGRIAAV